MPGEYYKIKQIATLEDTMKDRPTVKKFLNFENGLIRNGKSETTYMYFFKKMKKLVSVIWENYVPG